VYNLTLPESGLLSSVNVFADIILSGTQQRQHCQCRPTKLFEKNSTQQNHINISAKINTWKRKEEKPRERNTLGKAVGHMSLQVVVDREGTSVSFAESLPFGSWKSVHLCYMFLSAKIQ
jgi:hypothetical protein